MMHLLLAGQWLSEIHEESAAYGLTQNGCQISEFSWSRFFSSKLDSEKSQPKWLRAQEKYHFGPSIRRLNEQLVEQTLDLRPDVLFVFRGVNVWRRSLESIRKSNSNIKLVSYNNDNAFSPSYPRWMWRIYLEALPEYDVHFAYRHKDVVKLNERGSKETHLLLPWFDPRVHRPVVLDAEDVAEFGSDVTFIGHFEADDRNALVEGLVEQGLKVRVWGPSRGWSGTEYFRDAHPLRGDSYSKAIAASKVSLAFFSQLNRDEYTRRCFEIPAIGSPIVAPRTRGMQALFQDQVEVGLFHGRSDFVAQVLELVEDPSLRASRVRHAQERIWRDGHDVVSRMRTVVNVLARQCR